MGPTFQEKIGKKQSCDMPTYVGDRLEYASPIK